LVKESGRREWSDMETKLLVNWTDDCLLFGFPNLTVAIRPGC